MPHIDSELMCHQRGSKDAVSHAETVGFLVHGQEQRASIACAAVVGRSEHVGDVSDPGIGRHQLRPRHWLVVSQGEEIM